MTPIDARRLGLIFGVVGMAAAVAGVITAYALSRAFNGGSGEPSPTPTASPSAQRSSEPRGQELVWLSERGTP